MNREFHYYVIHYLALRAGFSDADSCLIASSSQFVDSSTVSHTVDTGRGLYRTIVTQDYGWWDDSFPRTVYVPFHFFPGDPDAPASRRRDGRTNPLNTTADSTGVKELLVAALKTRDLYRVGIALHTYADSWAHQNFSGALEDWNVVDPSLPIPSIGHAQALRTPDLPEAVWRDGRLESETVRNHERHLAAARKIYKYLSTYNRRPFHDVDEVMGELEEILDYHRPGRTAEERILDLIIAADIRKYSRREWFAEALVNPKGLGDDESALDKGYDKLLWLKDAALHRTTLFRRAPMRARDQFSRSHLYLWNEAAREHLGTAWQILPRRLYRLLGGDPEELRSGSRRGPTA